MKVQVKLHDGGQYETVIVDYDAKRLADEINGQTDGLVAIGDLIVHRGTVARIVPVPEQNNTA